MILKVTLLVLGLQQARRSVGDLVRPEKVSFPAEDGRKEGVGQCGGGTCELRRTAKEERRKDKMRRFSRDL